MDDVGVHLASAAVVRSERGEGFARPRTSVGRPLEHGRVRYEGMLYLMVRFVDVISIRRLGENIVRVRPRSSAAWKTLHRAGSIRSVRDADRIAHRRTSPTRPANRFPNFPRIAMPVRPAGKQSTPAALASNPPTR